jgi:hypothetical protein
MTSFDPKQFAKDTLDKLNVVATHYGKKIEDFLQNTVPEKTAPVIKKISEQASHGAEAAQKAWGEALPSIKKTVGQAWKSALHTLSQPGFSVEVRFKRLEPEKRKKMIAQLNNDSHMSHSKEPGAAAASKQFSEDEGKIFEKIKSKPGMILDYLFVKVPEKNRYMMRIFDDTREVRKDTRIYTKQFKVTREGKLEIIPTPTDPGKRRYDNVDALMKGEYIREIHPPDEESWNKEEEKEDEGQPLLTEHSEISEEERRNAAQNRTMAEREASLKNDDEEEFTERDSLVSEEDSSSKPERPEVDEGNLTFDQYAKHVKEKKEPPTPSIYDTNPKE